MRPAAYSSPSARVAGSTCKPSISPLCSARATAKRRALSAGAIVLWMVFDVLTPPLNPPGISLAGDGCHR